MTLFRRIRAAIALGAAVLFLTACAGEAAADPNAPLPAIKMTSGGGFSGVATIWTVAPDGSWTWQKQSHLTRFTPPPPRQGRLTPDQAHTLALLANAPALHRELRKRVGKCDVSDGEYERLEVGPDKYLANWCDENRPRIKEMRAKIVELTTGT